MTTTTTRLDRWIRAISLLASLLAILVTVNYTSEQWANKQLEALPEHNSAPCKPLGAEATYFPGGKEVTYCHN